MIKSLISCLPCFNHVHNQRSNEDVITEAVDNEDTMKLSMAPPENYVSSPEKLVVAEEVLPINSVDDSNKDDTPLPSKFNTSISRCDRKSCNFPRSTDPTGKSFAYCTSDCFWKDNKTLDVTKLTLLSEDDADYNTVKKRFTSTISAAQPNAKVVAIIRLQMPKEITNKFLEYKNEMIKSHGNKVFHKMFHGTYYFSTCDIMNINRNFCVNYCAVCGIIQNGLLKEKSNHQNQQSLWFAKSAATSLYYCRRNINLFTMFAVDVVDVNQSQDILVISRNEATLPRFLIIFKET